MQTHALRADAQANPIRKIVTLLQEMSKDIADQGEKEQELYDKSISVFDHVSPF